MGTLLTVLIAQEIAEKEGNRGNYRPYIDLAREEFIKAMKKDKNGAAFDRPAGLFFRDILNRIRGRHVEYHNAFDSSDLQKRLKSVGVDVDIGKIIGEEVYPADSWNGSYSVISIEPVFCYALGNKNKIFALREVYVH